MKMPENMIAEGHVGASQTLAVFNFLNLVIGLRSGYLLGFGY